MKGFVLVLAVLISGMMAMRHREPTVGEIEEVCGLMTNDNPESCEHKVYISPCGKVKCFKKPGEFCRKDNDNPKFYGEACRPDLICQCDNTCSGLNLPDCSDLRLKKSLRRPLSGRFFDFPQFESAYDLLE